jgi:hypothetical protein
MPPTPPPAIKKPHRYSPVQRSNPPFALHDIAWLLASTKLQRSIIDGSARCNIHNICLRCSARIRTRYYGIAAQRCKSPNGVCMLSGPTPDTVSTIAPVQRPITLHRIALLPAARATTTVLSSAGGRTSSAGNTQSSAAVMKRLILSTARAYFLPPTSASRL